MRHLTQMMFLRIGDSFANDHLMVRRTGCILRLVIGIIVSLSLSFVFSPITASCADETSEALEDDVVDFIDSLRSFAQDRKGKYGDKENDFLWLFHEGPSFQIRVEITNWLTRFFREPHLVGDRAFLSSLKKPAREVLIKTVRDYQAKIDNFHISMRTTDRETWQLDPTRFRPYSSRPSILEFDPKPWPGIAEPLRQRINNHFLASLEVALQLIELYRGWEVYLMARDFELVYDVLQVLLKDHPEELKRFHLLSISTRTRFEPNLKDYVVQHGLSDASAATGKRFLYVDVSSSLKVASGFGRVRQTLSPQHRYRIRPRVFGGTDNTRSLLWLGLGTSTSHLNENIEGLKKDGYLVYEKFNLQFKKESPVYFQMASTFLTQIDGKWESMHEVNKETFDSYFEQHRNLQQDLRFYLETDRIRALVDSRRKLYGKIYQATNGLTLYSEALSEKIAPLLRPEVISHNLDERQAKLLEQDLFETTYDTIMTSQSSPDACSRALRFREEKRPTDL